jgi:hypothetical protein
VAPVTTRPRSTTRAMMRLRDQLVAGGALGVD